MTTQVATPRQKTRTSIRLLGIGNAYDFIKYHFLYKIWYERNQSKYWEKTGFETRKLKEIDDNALKEHTDIQVKLIKQYLDGGPILDVGCGYGRLTEPLGSWGIDFSQAQLDVNKTTGKLFRGDISNLPFENNQFELAFCSCVLMHNPPLKAQSIVSEMARVASKVIIFEVVGKTNPIVWNHSYLKILSKYFTDIKESTLHDKYLDDFYDSIEKGHLNMYVATKKI